jgi:CubicO group peptidase (beta-lactamase class C family)
MVLNDGSLDGRTYLSPSTVREMTRRHTPETWERPQGLAFGSDGKTFGHGGAYGTDTQVDVATGLILGWLIQQEGPFYGDAASAKDTFQKAAIEKFGTR